MTTTTTTNAIDFLTNEAEAAEAEAERPPRMYWHNGEQSKAGDTPGDFYISANDLTDEPGAPWQPKQRFKGEDGYVTETLHIAPILVREQPYRVIKGINGAKDTWVWNLGRWQPGERIYTEVLCFVDGIAGPVNLIVKGLTGKAFTGRGTILSLGLAFRREAERIAKKPLPPWAFWLPVSTKRYANAVLERNKTIHAVGDVMFEDTGHGSSVTPPALYLPDGDTAARIAALFVGADTYRLGFEIKERFAAWAEEKRTNDDAPSEEAMYEAATLPAVGRNVPQPIGEGEEILPF